MIVLACDPGSRQSAILAYDGLSPHGPLRPGLCNFRVQDNATLLADMRRMPARPYPLLIETVESYGQRVGFDIFETVRWAGRFQEAWESKGGAVHVVPRRTVKMELCGTMKAKDADIRQALLFRFGDGTREAAIGTKAKPGPLHGIGSHLWAALAIAVVWHDQHGGAT